MIITPYSILITLQTILRPQQQFLIHTDYLVEINDNDHLINTMNTWYFKIQNIFHMTKYDYDYENKIILEQDK